MTIRKPGTLNYLAYGSGDFLGAGTMALTSAWLLYIYTTFCGLSPIEATSIFAMARIVDGVVSPLMGYLTDHFGSTRLGKRFGRRKFFILIGIPLVFSYSLMWLSDMTYVYYLLTYLFFEVVYTSILVPYETLVPEMTDDLKRKPNSPVRVSRWPSFPLSWPFFCQAFCWLHSAKIIRFPSSMPVWSANVIKPPSWRGLRLLPRSGRYLAVCADQQRQCAFTGLCQRFWLGCRAERALYV